MKRSAIAIALALLAATLAGGCYKLPKWSGEEPTVSPVENEALEACGEGKLTERGGALLMRWPYLQSVGQNEATVVWAAWPGEHRVVVATPEGDVVDTAASEYSGLPGEKKRRLALRDRRGPEALKPRDHYPLRADLDGLEPDTLYCYHLEDDKGPLTQPAPLLTAAPPDHEDPIRFLVIGDSGTGGPAQAAIAKRIQETAFDFMIFLGDIAYTEGTWLELHAHFFEVYRDYLRYVPAFPAIGNHETETQNGAPYYEAFVLPGKERYYSFDWGPVHFVSIDTNDFDRAHREWLAEDLAANRQPWTIIYGHHPIYTNAFRGARRTLRRQLEPILAEHDVDLYLAGHEHHYERFGSRLGVRHIISGGGGGRLTRLYGSFLTRRQEAVHHYLAFEVDRDRLHMRAIDIEGEEFDELILERREGERHIATE